MWDKNLPLLSSFNIRKTCLQYFTGAYSYQYKGTHLQKATTFSHSPVSTRRELKPLALVVANQFTSTQAPTYRRLQPSLIFQMPLEGTSNPLSLLLANSFTSTQVLTYRRLQPSLVFQLLLEGSSNPLALVLADMFTSKQALTYKML